MPTTEIFRDEGDIEEILLPPTLPEAHQIITDLQRQLFNYQSDLVQAARLQRSLMLEVPKQTPGFDIGVYYSPARIVGGDIVRFFEPIRTKDRTADLGILVADSMDKGMAAALYSAIALTHFQTATSLPFYDTPEKVMLYVNEQLLQFSEIKMYITGLYGLLDGEKGEFSYARCGHEQILLFDHTYQPINVTLKAGQPLGIFNNIQIDSGDVIIPPGGLLVIISDGIVDETDNDDNTFGAKTLTKVIQQNGNLPAADLAVLIEKEIRKFQNGTTQFDDHSLVVIKRELLNTQKSEVVFSQNSS
ncbi:hypothetical protein A3D78_01785 [Candidatus Gottesmanbacteria bacterium RIFCSPHIGHO2_02_FULL_39_14]|uniref:PPM-type phosphatase domain-containing protein n=1 Tax=Candidatus Gottesmanbacteria bacterium RIFCSPHIGHO2_02_FULL_39_14 TaxID=1798383 RepID=A0A1F6A1H2_9BACT|nr:MAG: hypothetical protein A3D78_01785 [Candidatus Gottesmanbacteria bacterium RIFCSPHIGHO2_02_FULL_39_14]